MSKASSSVRSLPYPAIEDGNFSFPEAVYEVSTKPDGKSGTRFKLKHKISNAPFIERLIEKGKARYGCMVAVPKTGYRQLEIAEKGNEQIVSWSLDIVGEPPMLGPVILFIGEVTKYKLTEKDGVASVWQGREIEIPMGARLARAQYLRPPASIQNLIKVIKKSDMKRGTFTVKQDSNQGFYFKLEASENIYHFLQNPQGQSDLERSILVHAVSQCFNILKDEYKTNDQWEQYSNLRALSTHLDREGVGHWSDDDFDAVKIATELYPIEFKGSEE